jgi:NAD(P)-dependent dehydrogenase (short-subunit alcohol dehydrogenase family)
VRQLAADDWRVYATCRHPAEADELNALAAADARVSVHGLDVTDGAQVGGLAAGLSDVTVDLLVNNAGVYFERWGKDVIGSIDYGDWEETFRVNVLGAVRVTEALVESLARSEHALVVAVSSHMGCIGDISSPNDYAYRSSKAAMNAAFRGLAYELAQRQIGVLLLHPGWVATRMGGSGAPVGVAESVAGMRQQIRRFEPGLSGRFFKFDGRELPW